MEHTATCPCGRCSLTGIEKAALQPLKDQWRVRSHDDRPVHHAVGAEDGTVRQWRVVPWLELLAELDDLCQGEVA